MGKKKLLIIGSSQGGYGGIEAFMLTIAKTALSWNEFELKLCFKIVKGYKVQEEFKEISEKISPQLYFVKPGSYNLFKLVKWADILYVQNTPPDVIFMAYLMRKKIFLTIHNWRKPIDKLHYFLWGLAIKMPQQRWYNSHFVWDTWEPDKKSPKSECVPTVSYISGISITPKERSGFLFIGRWIENKGILELLSAYKKCGFSAIDCPLTILGKGPLKPKIDSLIAELNLNEVILPGFVDEDKKAELIVSSKWIIAPSNTKEDLGLTPIEARMLGVPSIVTRDGGLPESGGEAALIAEPGDIESLASCMLKAATMTDTEYEMRCILAKKSLDGFLKPMEFYREAFNN